RAQQCVDILFAELPATLSAAKQAVGQLCLVALQLLNLFFHTAPGDQLVDENWFVLPDAIGAVTGLRFDSRVPPGIEMNHRICSRQVEAGAARLAADQKDRMLASLEFAHWRGAI